jgi:hypothetical protein
METFNNERRRAMTTNTGGGGDNGLNLDPDRALDEGAMTFKAGGDKDNGLNKDPNRKLDDGLNRDINEQAGDLPRNLVEEIADDIGSDS